MALVRLPAAAVARLLANAHCAALQEVSTPRKRKFRNVRCDQPLPGKPWSGWPECGRHPSHRQHQRYEELLLLQRAGQIRNLREEVAFELLPAVQLAGEARKKPAWRYYADAVYDELQLGADPAVAANWTLIVEDTKSPITRRSAAYRARKHAMKARYGLDIREV